VAEFFGGATRADNGTWEFLGSFRFRIREWRYTRARGLLEWTLPELLAVRTGTDLLRHSARKGDQTRLASLFYAQAWSFVHFLYHFDDGRYRDRFLAYAEKEFHAVTGPEVFEKFWFGGEPADWSGVEAEWLAYVEGLLEDD
jgi:hypothetical protein